MVEATFRHEPAIDVRRVPSRPVLAVPGIRDGIHHVYIVEADGELDQGVALFRLLHLLREFGVILRCTGYQLGVIFGVPVGTDAVADLSAEQLVYRQSSCLPGDVPEGEFDGADRRAPGLERAHVADLEHDARDVGRVFAQKILFIKEHHRFEIPLGRLGLTISGNALIGDDAHHRFAPDDGALEVGDFDRSSARPPFSAHRAGPLLSAERRCRGYPQKGSGKSSSRELTHEFLPSNIR
jgi:hypothetical protein